MRLACKQYAYLPRLNAILFHGIRLIASAAHLELIHTIDLSALKPYVKRIVFKSTKYSWVMTKPIFEQILLLGPAHDIIERENKRLREIGKARDDYSGLEFLHIDVVDDRFVEKYMNGNGPFSR